ncbi:hypothetical protein SAMN03159341_1651 [Paenibacillus sp. 1_12]|nr:hypothetical protein SAMN03159341_1651 [Paenibacillus sp. 1_12]
MPNLNGLDKWALAEDEGESPYSSRKRKSVVKVKLSNADTSAQNKQLCTYVLLGVELAFIYNDNTHLKNLYVIDEILLVV